VEEEAEGVDCERGGGRGSVELGLEFLAGRRVEDAFDVGAGDTRQETVQASRVRFVEGLGVGLGGRPLGLAGLEDGVHLGREHVRGNPTPVPPKLPFDDADAILGDLAGHERPVDAVADRGIGEAVPLGHQLLHLLDDGLQLLGCTLSHCWVSS